MKDVACVKCTVETIKQVVYWRRDFQKMMNNPRIPQTTIDEADIPLSPPPLPPPLDIFTSRLYGWS